MPSALKANTIQSLTNTAIGRTVLPKFELPPFPPKALKIIPELEDWTKEFQRRHEEFLSKAAVSINGGAV